MPVLVPSLGDLVEEFERRNLEEILPWRFHECHASEPNHVSTILSMVGSPKAVIFFNGEADCTTYASYKVLVVFLTALEMTLSSICNLVYFVSDFFPEKDEYLLKTSGLLLPYEADKTGPTSAISKSGLSHNSRLYYWWQPASG